MNIDENQGSEAHVTNTQDQSTDNSVLDKAVNAITHHEDPSQQESLQKEPVEQDQKVLIVEDDSRKPEIEPSQQSLSTEPSLSQQHQQQHQQHQQQQQQQQSKDQSHFVEAHPLEVDFEELKEKLNEIETKDKQVEKPTTTTADKKNYMKEYAEFNTTLIDKQNEEIRQEVEKDSPLVSDLLPLDMLEFEFAGNEAYLQKIRALKKEYPDYRKVRRDGSCFYRAFLFRLFEYMIKRRDQALNDRIIKTIRESKPYLIKAGYDASVLDVFIVEFLEILELIKKNIMGESLLLETFLNKVKSDSLVMYLRFITSGYLKMNAKKFECFLEGGMSIQYFCQTYVDPIDQECDQIQISALIAFLQLPIKILYLDGNINKTECDVIYLPEGAQQKDVFITLLYRPGHYDILYK